MVRTLRPLSKASDDSSTKSLLDTTIERPYEDADDVWKDDPISIGRTVSLETNKAPKKTSPSKKQNLAADKSATHDCGYGNLNSDASDIKKKSAAKRTPLIITSVDDSTCDHELTPVVTNLPSDSTTSQSSSNSAFKRKRSRHIIRRTTKTREKSNNDNGDSVWIPSDDEVSNEGNIHRTSRRSEENKKNDKKEIRKEKCYNHEETEWSPSESNMSLCASNNTSHCVVRICATKRVDGCTNNGKIEWDPTHNNEDVNIDHCTVLRKKDILSIDVSSGNESCTTEENSDSDEDCDFTYNESMMTKFPQSTSRKNQDSTYISTASYQTKTINARSRHGSIDKGETPTSSTLQYLTKYENDINKFPANLRFVCILFEQLCVLKKTSNKTNGNNMSLLLSCKHCVKQRHGTSFQISCGSYVELSSLAKTIFNHVGDLCCNIPLDVKEDIKLALRQHCTVVERRDSFLTQNTACKSAWKRLCNVVNCKI